MKARAVVALAVVAVLAVGGATWWALGGNDGTGSDQAAPQPEEDDGAPTATQRPSASPSPEPEGAPIADCAPEEPPGRVPRGFWGMHLNDPIGAAYPDAPITTVNLTTAQTYWNQIETAPGQYDFSRLDSIVETAEERGAQPMLVLGFTPSFHAPQPESATARTMMPDLAAWRAWVAAAVERYGARLDYQVWPEPNIASNWSGTPAQMARLTAVAGTIIHQRAPEAQVVSPAVALRLAKQRRWMERFWATEVEGGPVAESVDAVAVDPFPLEDGTAEDSLDLVCAARDILATYGVDLPLWTNEINYGVPSGGHATDVQPYSEDRQAAAVARTYLTHAAIGVDRVYWLGWFSSPGMAVELARDGVTTPAGEAFSVVRRWLDHGPRPQCVVRRGMHTCLVEGRERTLRIRWRVRGTSTVAAGDGAVRVENLAGDRRRVTPGDRVRVGQSPVAVVSGG